jgi:hypothetical protein
MNRFALASLFLVALAGSLAFACSSNSDSDCPGPAPQVQCYGCSTTPSTVTAVCLDHQWGCGLGPPCVAIPTLPCGATLCQRSDQYCALSASDGGGTCEPLPACNTANDCDCIDASPGCSCAQDDAGTTVTCSPDAGSDAGGDASDAASE